jgi:formylglycine-generating enzyme required for sulfatase activity
VGSFPLDRSPYGVLDLAGNVAEWTSSTASSGNFRGLRRILGGRWDSPIKLAHERLGWINHLHARHFDLTIGLRCVERVPVIGPGLQAGGRLETPGARAETPGE